MIRVMLADDHSIVRAGLKQILCEEADFTVVAEAANGDAVLPLLRQELPGVLLLDMSMPGRSGIDLMKLVKAEFPKLPILVLSMHKEEQYAVRAIKAGAAGYLTKESAAEQLIGALRKVAAGGLFISPTVAERLALAKQKRDAELEQSEVSRRRQSHENANQTREARNKLRELETNLTLAEKRAKDDSLTDGLDAEAKSYLKEANERTLSAMREQKGYLEGQIRLLEEAESKAAKVYDMTVKQAKFDWEAIEKASVVKAEFTGNALVVCRDNLDAQATGTFRAGTPMVVLQDLTQTDVVIEAVPQPWTELRPERLAVAPRLPSGQAPAAVFKESRPGKSEGDALRYVFSFPAGAELRSLHGKPLDFDIHYRLTAGNPAESPYQVLSKDALYRFDPKLDFSRLMKSFNERHKDEWIMLVEGHAEVALVSAARAKSPTPAAQ